MFLNLTIGINTPCKHRCVMESECVSVNIGPPLNGRVVCELSNSDHVKYPEDIKQRPGWMYTSHRGTNCRQKLMMICSLAQMWSPIEVDFAIFFFCTFLLIRIFAGF